GTRVSRLCRKSHPKEIGQDLPDVLVAEEGGIRLDKRPIDLVVGISQRPDQVRRGHSLPLRVGGVQLLADRAGRGAVVPGNRLRLLECRLEVVRTERPARVFLLERRHLDRHRRRTLACPAHVRTDHGQARARLPVTSRNTIRRITAPISDTMKLKMYPLPVMWKRLVTSHPPMMPPTMPTITSRMMPYP